MSISIIEDIIPKGYKNRPGYKNSMTYLTIHETGNSSKGANAKAHAGALKGSYGQDTPASWHYTVDDTVAYRHLPDNESGYHTGDGGQGQSTKTNIKGGGALNSIGIETCVNSDGDFIKAVENAAWLAAQLCKKYNIPISNIVQHNFWKSTTYPSGKNCPQNLRAGKCGGWDGFISKVKSYLGKSTEPVFTPYMVRVSAGTLNIRKGAGTDYAATGKITDKGSYTIVEESTGTGANLWGRLKSGAGWISLDYTKKV